MYIHNVPIYMCVCGDIRMHDFPQVKPTTARKGHTDINVHVHVSKHPLMYTCLLALWLLFSASSELWIAFLFDGFCVIASWRCIHYDSEGNTIHDTTTCVYMNSHGCMGLIIYNYKYKTCILITCTCLEVQSCSSSLSLSEFLFHVELQTEDNATCNYA